MGLCYTFETVDMGDEFIAVPVGEGATDVRGVLKLNAEGKEVFDLLANNYSVEMIIEALIKKYDNPRQEIENYVSIFLSNLRENGVLGD